MPIAGFTEPLSPNPLADSDYTPGRGFDPSLLGLSQPSPVSGSNTITLEDFAANSILFVGSDKYFAEDNANFSWDDTDNELNIANLQVVTTSLLGGATNYISVASGGVLTMQGTATIDGVGAGNLLDKSANETVAGAWTFSDQITSTIAIGTSPFAITSTTVVTNLNADKADGYDFDQSLLTTDNPTFVKVEIEDLEIFAFAGL